MLPRGEDGGDNRKRPEAELTEGAGSRHSSKYAVGEQSAEAGCQSQPLLIMRAVMQRNRQGGQ